LKGGAVVRVERWRGERGGGQSGEETKRLLHRYIDRSVDRSLRLPVHPLASYHPPAKLCTDKDTTCSLPSSGCHALDSVTLHDLCSLLGLIAVHQEYK